LETGARAEIERSNELKSGEGGEDTKTHAGGETGVSKLKRSFSQGRGKVGCEY